MVLTQTVSHFPAGVHTLVLVSDPAGVLADEEVLTALAEPGFTLVNEPDPVRLRHRVEQARPFCADRSLIVVTTGPLEELPYDLWQQGHHVTLALVNYHLLMYPSRAQNKVIISNLLLATHLLSALRVTRHRMGSAC